MGSLGASACAVVFAVFCCHILLTNLLKLLFSTLKFSFPIFTTAGHMALSFLAAHVYIMKMGGKHTVVPWRQQVRLIFPVAAFQAASLGFTNIGITRVFPSFVALVGSSGPVFTLLLAQIFRTEDLNMTWAYLAMVPVVFGTIINCTSELSFDTIGFVLILVGTFLRSAKVCLQTKLLCGDMKLDALSLLYVVTPWQFGIFFVWALAAEGTAPFGVLATPDRWRSFVVLLLTAVMAALYNILAFQSVKLLSGTMVMLLGQVNVPCIILLSALFFGNPIATNQYWAFLLTAGGAYIFNTFGKNKPPIQSKIIEVEDNLSTSMDTFEAELDDISPRKSYTDLELNEERDCSPDAVEIGSKNPFFMGKR